MSQGRDATAAIDNCLKTSYRKCITISENDVATYNVVTTMPVLRTTWAWVCAIMNLVICGTGTVLMAILGDANVSKTHFFIGVIQFSAWVQSIILLGIFGMI